MVHVAATGLHTLERVVEDSLTSSVGTHDGSSDSTLILLTIGLWVSDYGDILAQALLLFVVAVCNLVEYGITLFSFEYTIETTFCHNNRY